MCLVGTECDVESIDSRRFKQSGNHRERIPSTKHDIGWIDTVGMSPYLPSRKIVRMFRKICPFYSSTGRKSDSWKSDTQLRLLRATAWVESEREKKNEKKKRGVGERHKKISLSLSNIWPGQLKVHTTTCHKLQAIHTHTHTHTHSHTHTHARA